MKLKWLQSKRLVSYNAGLVSSGEIYYVLIELFVYNLIPTPFYTGMAFGSYNYYEKTQIDYSFNEFFSLLILVRVFMVFRILLANSRFLKKF